MWHVAHLLHELYEIVVALPMPKIGQPGQRGHLSYGAAQWVQISCRQLAIELAWSTPGKVRAALDRLRTFGLVDVRFAAGKTNRLEYRVDLANADAVLNRLGDQATEVAALRDAFSVRRSSPMAELIRRAAPRVDSNVSHEAECFNARSTTRGSHLAAALFDQTPMGLNALIKTLQSALEVDATPVLSGEPTELMH